MVYLFEDFSKDEWNKLKNDFTNWSSHQLNILADSFTVIDKKVNYDTNELLGFIFTIVEDSEADYLIQNLKVLDDGIHKPKNLLIEIKQRLNTLENYTKSIHNIHNYDDYHSFINSLLK